MMGDIPGASSTPTKRPPPTTGLPSPSVLESSFSCIEHVEPLDSSYRPETTINSPSTSSEEETERDWHTTEAIVYQPNLMSLFKRCQTCGQLINSTDVSFVGAMMKVKWDCLGGHSGTWCSSPEVRGMAEVNLLGAASVLFAGGTYTDLEEWSRTMGLKMFSATTFYDIQKPYLHPVIEELFQKQRADILVRVYMEQEDGKRPHLSGDAGCDTPGFSAKYCHYTFMLDGTKEIVQTDLIQVTEASSSVMMEPVGFKRGLAELLGQGLDDEVLTTDQPPSIRKIMRDQFPEITHQVDIWHTAKSFQKKLMNKAKKRGRGTLVGWSRSVTNHMWFSCGICKGNTKELKRRWVSILHHVLDVHTWTEEGEEYRCLHAPLTAADRKKKVWLTRESMAFEEPSSLVQDKRLLKDLEQMGLFKHTGALEVFHSVLLKYIPKRQSFSYVGMKERGHLAILEHNENIVKRKQARTSTGELQFKFVFCKRSKQWVLKKVYEPHTTDFRERLIQLVMERRLDTTVTFKAPTSSLQLPQPPLPANIASAPRPSKQEAVAKFKSRFSKECLVLDNAFVIFLRFCVIVQDW